MSGLFDRQFRSLYIGLAANYAVIGIGMTIISATLPKILSDFSWSYTAAGAVIAAAALGDLAASLSGGVLLERIGPKAALGGGLLLQAGSLAFFAQTPSIPLNFALNLLVGFGQGGIDVAMSYSVARIQKHGENRPMSFLHSAFSIGAVAGPLTIGLIVRSGLPWQLIYRGFAAVILLMATTVFLLPFSRIAMSREERGSAEKAERPSRLPLFYVAALFLLLYVGLENGASRWAAEYLVTVRGASASAGAFVLSVFWAGIFVGRLGIPVVFRRVEHDIVVISLSILAAVSITLTILAPSLALSGFGFFFTGLGCSAIFPTIMTIVGNYFRRGQARAIGFAATGGSVGALALPFLLSLVSDRFGLRNGFWLLAMIGALMIGVAGSIVRAVRGRR